MTLLCTNYCKNPSFEVNVTDDWSFVHDGAGGSANLDATQSYVGGKSCRIRADNNHAYIWTVVGVSVPNGATVTGHARIRCSADPTGNKASILVFDLGVLVGRTYATAASNGNWEYLTASYTNTSGGARTFYFYCENWFADSAADVWFDACQLELGPATAYTDGSLGGQCAWTGTAHNSTSTRTLATQAVAGAQTNTGTVTKGTRKILAGAQTNTGIVAAVKGLGLLLIARLRDYFLRAEQVDHALIAGFRDYVLTAPQREKHVE